jgi:hypothetical protein
VKRVVLSLLLLAAPAWASDPPAAAPPVVTLPAARRVAVGERFSLVPVVANGGTPKYYAPDPGLREDRTFLDLIPDELATKLKGRVFYAESPGTYRIVVYVAGDNRTASDVAICTVTAGDVPPGPGPGPGPVPPGPDPDPFANSRAAPGLKCLIVVETSDLSKLPPSQVTVLTAAAVRQYLNAKCVKEGTQPAWRVWDRDVSTANESPLWQKAFAKVPRDKVPWVLIGDGTRGYSGPLPATVDETIKLLTKFGG